VKTGQTLPQRYPVRLINGKQNTQNPAINLGNWQLKPINTGFERYVNVIKNRPKWRTATPVGANLLLTAQSGRKAR
jgi:hypothetical protein